jgi:hypothetical protein
MRTTEATQYRGYEIIPQRQWSSWCARVYPTRADLPIVTRSTLLTLATRKMDAIGEAKQSIDRVLAGVVKRES